MRIVLMIVFFVAIAAAVSSCTKSQIQTALCNHTGQDITTCAKINHPNFLSNKQNSNEIVHTEKNLDDSNQEDEIIRIIERDGVIYYE